MLTSERFLHLVFGEAPGQAVKHNKPACRWCCKSWHREVTQWTVAAQTARPPRFWLPWLTFTRTQTARSQARKQTQIWLRYTRQCRVALKFSSLRSLDLEKGHWTATKWSQRLARYKLLGSVTNLAMFQIILIQQTYSVCQCSILIDTMLTSERFLHLVFGEAPGQAVKHNKPAPVSL